MSGAGLDCHQRYPPDAGGSALPGLHYHLQGYNHQGCYYSTTNRAPPPPISPRGLHSSIYSKHIADFLSICGECEGVFRYLIYVVFFGIFLRYSLFLNLIVIPVSVVNYRLYFAISLILFLNFQYYLAETTHLRPVSTDFDQTRPPCIDLRIDYCGFGPFSSTPTNLLMFISLHKVLIYIMQ